MIVISLILFSSVLLPLIAPKANKKFALLISWGVLFFVWAFQYQMSIDWFVYVTRWQSVVQNISLEYRDLEPVYKFIITLCIPLSFYGFLILSAFISICILKRYTDRYISVKYQWLFFVTFSLGPTYCLEFINTNRQTWAIMFVMLSVFTILEFLNNKRIKYYFLSILLIFSAFHIHKSAIISLPILLLPFFIIKRVNSKFLYIFLFINILAFFIDFSSLSMTADILLDSSEGLDGFSHYGQEIVKRQYSIIEQSIFTGILLFMIVFFNKFSDQEKLLVLIAICYLSFQGYAMYTMLRALSYYRIFFPIVLPICYERVLQHHPKYKLISSFFVAFYFIYMIYRYSVDIYGPNYVGYENFKTIFSAPEWM